MTQTNRRVVLSRTPKGVPDPRDFEVETVPLPALADDQVLVRHEFLSLDPYQRSAIAGRHPPHDRPLNAGDMPPGETVGRVVESRSVFWESGDAVRHPGGWQEYSVASAGELSPVDTRRAPASAWLGVLGMPGLTAWASIVELADVQPGQTVLVSAAAGPVGATLGQIAIQRGARVVGIAGSDEKCRYLTSELGFVTAVNHRHDDYLERLHAALPDGADIYHDNVGGQMLADAFGVLKPYGIVILCGLMSAYNDASRRVDLYIGLPIVRRAVMKGLVVYDFEDRRDEFVETVLPWIIDGRMRYREDRAQGIESVGDQFCRLMRGENLGKALVELHPV